MDQAWYKYLRVGVRHTAAHLNRSERRPLFQTSHTGHPDNILLARNNRDAAKKIGSGSVYFKHTHTGFTKSLLMALLVHRHARSVCHTTLALLVHRYARWACHNKNTPKELKDDIPQFRHTHTRYSQTVLSAFSVHRCMCVCLAHVSRNTARPGIRRRLWLAFWKRYAHKQHNAYKPTQPNLIKKGDTEEFDWHEGIQASKAT